MALAARTNFNFQEGISLLTWSRFRPIDRGFYRGRTTPNEDIGTKVGTIRPNDRPRLSAHLEKEGMVTADRLEDWTDQQRRNISLDHSTVRQRQSQAKTFKGNNIANSNQTHTCL